MVLGEGEIPVPVAETIRRHEPRPPLDKSPQFSAPVECGNAGGTGGDGEKGDEIESPPKEVAPEVKDPDKLETPEEQKPEIPEEEKPEIPQEIPEEEKPEIPQQIPEEIPEQIPEEGPETPHKVLSWIYPSLHCFHFGADWFDKNDGVICHKKVRIECNCTWT